MSRCTHKSIDKKESLFQEVSAKDSNILFSNQLVANDSLNFFTYSYFYLGGGVAVGDFNNDGQQDVFFTGNMVDNALYLNQGNFVFKDISKTAKIKGENRWSMGCAVVDINADGWLDIYVSVAGNTDDRSNMCFVNKGLNEEGIPIFEEEAKLLGLDDKGHSIQATFLDYDKDGDLDVFVANYEITQFNLKTTDYKQLMDDVSWVQSDHLYRNDGDGFFKDVTEETGLLNFGLTVGVIAADLNKDGWTDLYLSNDFHTPDRMYLNQGDGTFKDVIHESMQHTAFYGMGVDVADYNNDGYMDLMQVDMTPADNFRSKTNMASMDIQGFRNLVNQGMHHQYMYNSLQTCGGILPDGKPFYAETAKLSNLDKTDWSWACLFGDYDNDGFKDLFISNGVRRDINNKDFFKWINRVDIQLKIKYKELSLADLSEKMPAQKVDNYIFRNKEGASFEKVNDAWGLHFEGFSNGAAYADLDNDGDLELIVNNIDSTASIFRNFASEQNNHNFLTIDLQGPAKNPQGIGTKISIKTGDKIQWHEHTLVRGYESSMDERIHFGLGKDEIIDELIVFWADGKKTYLNQVAVNQILSIDYIDAKKIKISEEKSDVLFTSVDKSLNCIIDYLHTENSFDDFEREILLPHQLSSFGPALAIGDVNKDGIEDVYIGGAKGQAGRLFLCEQQKQAIPSASIKLGKKADLEAVDALFFDPDNDGDLDLYVVTGGNESVAGSEDYNDIFYENNGTGNLVLREDVLPDLRESGSKVVAGDYDGDGDEDLFIGGRQVPGQYPNPANSHILENISTIEQIAFRKVTESIAPELLEMGMVTDAIWDDFDGDADLDLIVVGEWMTPTFLENREGQFSIIPVIEQDLTGWWNCIEKGDFDGDGDNDYVLGNLGLNYKYKANSIETFDIYAGDLDANGKQDVVLSYKQDGEQFPVRGKQCSSEQMPILNQKFKNYRTFAQANLAEIYSPEKLKKSKHYQAQEFGHVYIENVGDGQFVTKRLPLSTQISSVNAMLLEDFNGDGHLDVLMAGNLFDSEVETPRNDACYGWVLLGDGQGGFEFLPYEKTGLYVPYETRHIGLTNINDQKVVLFANNDAPLLLYKWNESEAMFLNACR